MNVSEQNVYTDSGAHRLTLRQVGWLGQTGRMYTMDEDPSHTEGGSFSPLLIVAHSERVADLVTDYPEEAP